MLLFYFFSLSLVVNLASAILPLLILLLGNNSFLMSQTGSGGEEKRRNFVPALNLHTAVSFSRWECAGNVLSTGDIQVKI